MYYSKAFEKYIIVAYCIENSFIYVVELTPKRAGKRAAEGQLRTPAYHMKRMESVHKMTDAI